MLKIVQIVILFIFFSVSFTQSAFSYSTHSDDSSLHDLSVFVNLWINKTNPEQQADDAFKVKTHPWLTLRMIQLFEDYYKITLDPATRAAVIFGSIEEDWDINGLSTEGAYTNLNWDDRTCLPPSCTFGNGNIDPYVNRAENHFFSTNDENTGKLNNNGAYKNGTYVAVDTSRNVSALKWAKNDFRNLANFSEAVRQGQTYEGWKALGHVLHLLEDMSVPAHVRNDVHIINKDNYEFYLNEKPPVGLYSLIGTTINVSPIEAGEQLDQFFINLSTHTRSNYFSDDSVFKDVVFGITLPVANVANEDGNYFYNDSGKRIAHKGFLYKIQMYSCIGLPGACYFKYMVDPNALKKYAQIDENVVEDTFSDVGLKAIQYGAGLMKLFYDQTNASTYDTTSPSVPASLSAIAISTTQINLSWMTSSDNVAVTGYRVYRAGTQVGTSATASYSDTGLNPATQYCYTVSAYDAAGNVSGQSILTCDTTSSNVDTTAPSIPSGITASAVSSSQISLSWAASFDNVGVTGYRVYRDGTQRATSVTVSYSNTGLSASTEYCYTVSAYDAAGNESTKSGQVCATTGVLPQVFTATDFVDTWVNDDPNTRGITRIFIGTDGYNMTVHVYGKCYPTDCDWGTITVPYTGNPFLALYYQGYATRTLTIELVVNNSLHVHWGSVFHDGTNRDYTANDYFHRNGP